jgi:predicted transcriptional regulator
LQRRWSDFRAGIIASTIANVNRGKRKKPYKPADFMPKEEIRTGKKTWQEQLAWIEMINAAMRGKDLRKKK